MRKEYKLFDFIAFFIFLVVLVIKNQRFTLVSHSFNNNSLIDQIKVHNKPEPCQITVVVLRNVLDVQKAFI